MHSQAFAILWAQWKALANFHVRSHRTRFPFALLIMTGWYGLWAFAAFSTGVLLSDAEMTPHMRGILSAGFFVVTLYWQITPIVMVTTGLSLQLGRLLVYPIPYGQLFAIEVLLRISTCFEMVLLSVGAMIGLIVNPDFSAVVALPITGFILFNLFLSTALRDLLGRLLARKRIREFLVFGLVLIAALPQLLLISGAADRLQKVRTLRPSPYWPWGAAARVIAGQEVLVSGAVLIGWVALAYWFGRRQFERSLRFDFAAAKSTDAGSRRSAWLEALLRVPAMLLRDPVAAMVEKELRFLSRSPRFRLLFLMGFSFGLLIWLPMAMNNDDPDSFVRQHFLTVVSVYALMLLGEALFWNIFGYDRSAAQVYFAMPVSIAAVLKAKNLAAAIFLLLEFALVASLCLVLRMPVTGEDVVEAALVVAVLALFLLAIGNLLSMRNPRAVDPSSSWRNSSVGRVQAYLLLLYPVASAPILLAYGARYAFDSDAAFYGVLAFDILLGAVVYSIATESAVQMAETRKEEIITALSRGEGPVAS